MSESYGDPQKGRNRGGPREGRGSGNREGGGFRIRLSDNEMRASRAIQEAFNLRSTVAVLGFALRTLGQMLEDGKLDSLISEYRSQNPNTNRNQSESNGKKFHPNNKVTSKPDPFARPSKPESSQTEENLEKEDNALSDSDKANDHDVAEDITTQEKDTNSTDETT